LNASLAKRMIFCDEMREPRRRPVARMLASMRPLVLDIRPLRQ
jgi:hypothetical protein